MYYVQLDDVGRVIAYTESASNPDRLIWIDSPWTTIPEDFPDYKLIDDVLVYDPQDLPPTPFGAEQVLASLLQETDILDELPDSTLEHMAPYMAMWAAATSYTVGDKVQYQERPYRCLQAHISQEGWEPESAPSLWARIIASEDPDNPLPWEQPDSTNPYMQGDRVTHNGKVWESDVDNNVWEPGVYGWTEVA